MLDFRNVALWFIALLVITVVGFWPTYFRQLPSGPHLTHHLHGITMLLWMLLLITQALGCARTRSRCTAGSAACRSCSPRWWC